MAIQIEVPQADYSALVTRARLGDERAWRELFERDREMVFRVAYRIVLDREEALDIVQESFSKAFQHLSGFQDGAAWGGWLRTIAVRTAISRMRGLARIKRLLGRRIDDEEMNRIGARDGAAVRRIEQRELAEAMNRAMRRLSTRQRAVATLHFEQGLSNPEIAATIEIPYSTVKVHLHRARLVLREHLAGFLPMEFQNEQA
jgi:RNA polymerase sigma-70 factor (ECF subfamily)